ncbi:CHC2 zinc finger domain-containing protein [uncultured Piscinibacter sp.]|uniref:CHC2 zinc finger domain-containing protein n=1 Tax=uncultured Piscinibacter sp. TaxID=1131835 RepID=UPI002604F475|nr:CHC2 zinc finger domain-containing protein [uncultured Piscinibacter sp.]
MSFVRERLPDPMAYLEAEGLHPIGSGRWRTVMCPFHGENTPSLRVNTVSGGWVCMGCGAKGGDVLAFHMERHGLDFVEAARALGAWSDDGKPNTDRPRTLSARDAMQVVAFELNVAIVVISDIRRGVIPTDADWQRFLIGAGRIQKLAGEFA